LLGIISGITQKCYLFYRRQRISNMS